MSAATSATPNYRLSSAGYKEVLKTEGNIPYVYDDQRTGPLRPLRSYDEAIGTPTIGIGVAINSPERRKQFEVFLTRQATPEELETINRVKLDEYMRSLNKRLGPVKISQSMYDALFSLYWNSYSGAYPVIEAVKRGDYEGAVQAIKNGPKTARQADGSSKYSEGLARRRMNEAALFAKEGLKDFVVMGEEAAESVRRNPVPYLFGVTLVAGTTFFLTRSLTK
jgi:GH24 family phage-related lysozyme (muramidase)